MRRADLLRAGGAAAVIHFGLVNVRQKALVAVFIWRQLEQTLGCCCFCEFVYYKDHEKATKLTSEIQ